MSTEETDASPLGSASRSSPVDRSIGDDLFAPGGPLRLDRVPPQAIRRRSRERADANEAATAELPELHHVGGRWKRHEKFWRATAAQLAESERRQIRDRRHVVGRYGERLAEEHFVNVLGAKLLERNFQVQYGEIDLLFEHDGGLVAVEVKTRDVEDPSQPIEYVHRAQLGRIARALITWAQDNERIEDSMRIDVVAIVAGPDGSVQSFEHVPNVYER
jgi:Holliday junction resolvase-like predicted endonuclease